MTLPRALRRWLRRLVEPWDELTDLYTQRYLSARLLKEIRRARRKSSPLTGVLIDIDHFKRVNDQHGHHAGDVVLRQLAARIRRSVKTRDIVARHSGPRFVVVASDLEKAEALALGERIRQFCGEPVADNGASNGISVTVSVGICWDQLSAPANSLIDSALLRKADLALYEAKRAGGNCVVLFDEVEGAIISTNTAVTIEELYGIDGNTITKLGAKGTQLRARNQAVPVEIWLSGELGQEEEQRLRQALEGLLKAADASLERYDPPVRGSFYQKLQFLGAVTKYSERILQNLKSAFGALATKYQVEAVKDLALILEKQENAVIRIDQVIAIKITRKKRVHTLITFIPPNVIAALDKDPTLISRPAEIYDLMALPTNVAQFGRQGIATSSPQEE